MAAKRLISRSLMFARGCVTNAVAVCAPRVYTRLIGDSGRGPEEETPESLAEYCRLCVEDYAQMIVRATDSDAEPFNQKDVVEYGPGDFLGTAVLMLAHGARSVTCVDRFPLVRFRDLQRRALALLLDTLPPDRRYAASAGFVSLETGQLNSERLRYVVSADGLIKAEHAFDVAVSRAVLEHTRDPSATFRDVEACLREGGVSAHLVDLRSHRLHDDNELDFLTWPDWMWNAMFSGKGAPNRLRVDAYRRGSARAELETIALEPLDRYPASVLSEIRPLLPKRFSTLSDEELSWKAFWVLQVKRTSESARLTPRPTQTQLARNVA